MTEKLENAKKFLRLLFEIESGILDNIKEEKEQLNGTLPPKCTECGNDSVKNINLELIKDYDLLKTNEDLIDKYLEIHLGEKNAK